MAPAFALWNRLFSTLCPLVAGSTGHSSPREGPSIEDPPPAARALGGNGPWTYAQVTTWRTGNVSNAGTVSGVKWQQSDL